MRSTIPLIVFFLLVGSTLKTIAAAPKSSDEIDESGMDSHTFSLLPKAFQKNPELEMTGFTVMTDYGKTQPLSSPKNPVYYQIHNGGEQLRGEITTYKEVPTAAVLADMLERSLSAAGYQPAKAAQKPALLLNYFWGAHDRMNSDTAEKFPELARNYVIERALLIGGKDYARRLSQELDRPSLVIDHTLKADFLRDQAKDDLFYVVVSAYKLEDVAHHKPQLLWRTTMTVNSHGINMVQGMPALIVMGKDFYGRESTQPMALRRDVRSGSVKLGPLEILESGASVSAPGSPK
jgi:hypothetical protein